MVIDDITGLYAKVDSIPWHLWTLSDFKSEG